LLPHKAKQFISPTAKKLGYSDDLVEDVVMLYWQSVRDALSKPQNISITIADFGVFSVKPWKLDTSMIKNMAVSNNITPTTFTKCVILKQYEDKKETLDKLVLQFADLKLKKESIKEKRYGKDKTNLEE